MKYLAAAIAVLMLLGVAVLGVSQIVATQPGFVAGDVLGDCYTKDRAMRVKLLREMSGETFSSDQVKGQEWNKRFDAEREAIFKTWVDDELAKAFDGDTLNELADKLEAVQ